MKNDVNEVGSLTTPSNTDQTRPLTPQADLPTQVSHERFRYSQRLSRVASWECDIALRHIYLSEELLPLYGRPAQEKQCEFVDYLALVHPEDRDRVSRDMLACADHEACFRTDFRAIWPDGSVHWLQHRGDVACSEAGEPLRMYGVVLDVTERKLAQIALEESNAKFEATASAAVDAVIIMDDEGRVEFWNRAAEDMFGYTADEVMGRDLHALVSSDQYGPAYHQAIQNFARTGTGKAIGSKREFIARRKDGTTFPVEIALSSFQLNDHWHAAGIVHDISHRVRAQRKLLKAKAKADKAKAKAEQAMLEARRANQAKSEFLSRMSHELRTPLNSILGFSQLLLTGDAPMSEEDEEFIRHIKKGGEHLLYLINEVLDLAKVESGRLDVEMETFPLAECLLEAVDQMQPMAQQSQIRLEVSALARQATAQILADRMRLRQVLLNLISNAIKYNRPEGSVYVSVDIDTRRQRLSIEVQDTGIGISPQDQSAIFEPFNRLGQESSHIEGAGIGLAVTRKLVELMDGRLYLSSVKGEGSCFGVELSMGQPAGESESETIENSTEFLRCASCSRICSILYVDDNTDNLKLMQAMLARHQALRLQMATDADSGLAMARDRRSCIMLMDVNMPGKDGITAVRELKSDAAISAIPVVAVSADVMPADIQRCLDAGFDGFLPKPIDNSSLITSLQKACELNCKASGTA